MTKTLAVMFLNKMDIFPENVTSFLPAFRHSSSNFRLYWHCDMGTKSNFLPKQIHQFLIYFTVITLPFCISNSPVSLVPPELKLSLTHDRSMTLPVARSLRNRLLWQTFDIFLFTRVFEMLLQVVFVSCYKY